MLVLLFDHEADRHRYVTRVEERNLLRLVVLEDGERGLRKARHRVAAAVEHVDVEHDELRPALKTCSSSCAARAMKGTEAANAATRRTWAGTRMQPP